MNANYPEIEFYGHYFAGAYWKKVNWLYNNERATILKPLSKFHVSMAVAYKYLGIREMQLQLLRSHGANPQDSTYKLISQLTMAQAIASASLETDVALQLYDQIYARTDIGVDQEQILHCNVTTRRDPVTLTRVAAILEFNQRFMIIPQ